MDTLNPAEWVMVRHADLEALLARTQTPTAPPASPLLSPEDAARILAISTSTVHNLIARGDLHVIRMGRVIRIHPSDVDALIEQRRHQ